MKRFHVNLGVTDIGRSAEFYTTLFGEGPTVLREDYAKWMLDDPAVNFSLTPAIIDKGVNHLGLQVDSSDDLALIQSRLQAAAQQTVDQPDAECCYASSSKTWVRDPDDVAWETFVTHGQITHYGDSTETPHPGAQTGGTKPGKTTKPAKSGTGAAAERCCGPAAKEPCCI